MRIFLAGIIQGGRLDDGIHPQDYRADIRTLVEAHLPDAEIIDPHAENPGRLDWDRSRQREMFLRYVAEARRCDLLVAWLPEPSMGTAIEMYEAHRAGATVVAITPMRNTWAVFSLVSRCFPDIESFGVFLRESRNRLLRAGSATAVKGA